MIQIEEDFHGPALDAKTRAILEHGEWLTKNASKIASEDIERLRGTGVSDDEILTMTLIAGFFNHQDRVADGLGVQLDEAFAR